MIENTFTAALTFALLVGGTLAVGSEMTNAGHAAAHADASRSAAVATVVLPTVEVTGHRAVLTLASADRATTGAVQAD